MTKLFVGTWDTEFEGLGPIPSGKATLTVTESFRFDSGSTLDGMYEGLQGSLPSTLHGSPEGSVWKGTWANTPSSAETGDFTFTLGKDGKTFTGTWGQGKGEPQSKKWNGSRKRNHVKVKNQSAIPPLTAK